MNIDTTWSNTVQERIDLPYVRVSPDMTLFQSLVQASRQFLEMGLFSRFSAVQPKAF